MNDNAALLAQRLIRNLEEVEKTHDRRPPLYDSVGARLGTGTAANKLGASIDVVAPGMRSCPYHFHYAQEEMFIVLEGTGTLRVAGEQLPIKSGDVIFIPPGPEYPHQIINTSAVPLKYLSVSTREQPELVEYPDSGKFQATAQRDNGQPVRYLQRPSASLDYWEGEP
ncbi:Cupin 2 conserved barrel domain protein [Serratia sp. AS12]|uniref:cupin domain-containing protein n=1 Tax=Serratia TaxID=613 RepID=UPI00020E9932|nr:MULTISPECIES: cupin domain-containing protein [Serratia]AEF45298.1 Cupin 2 conserved barrel domain protein [Serratia plymuthica AS9]AEF50249.1 Cupin 2 conserved barrel domain protein [Serratia sp. AS12]AEG27956.1 Cupin 2 conserved barrel domain protein [Serratia sp. AS13]UTN98776.1 cupin domain-containing protein [Serratia plymuthica]